MRMRAPYVYLFTVRFDPSAHRWVVRAHWSDGEITRVNKPLRFRRAAVSLAKKRARERATLQGVNLRLDLVVRNESGEITDTIHYGRDPRV